MSNYNRLDLKERVRIEAGIYAEKSFSLIAEELGRNKSSITREVKQNRIQVKMPRVGMKECIYPLNCSKRNLCGDYECTMKCWRCREYNCEELCSRFKDHTCSKLEKAPFVCNTCSEKNKKKCIHDKYYYISEKADAKSKRLRSESREGIRTDEKELQTIDDLVSTLVRQGQPLSHICAAHKDEITVSERSIYNYIDAGELSICNLDLRRKVRYKRRRKKPEEIRCNKFDYRQGRTYTDYLAYMEEHPDTEVVEMDTVKGRRGEQPVLLTLMFRKNSVMIIFLMKDETIDEVLRVFDWLTKQLGIRRFRKLFQLILTDNGGCFKGAPGLEFTPSGSPRTKVFYCDPQASWQKPHLEKNHEYIRYVLPKGTSFKGLTQADVTLMSNHINSTTRPALKHMSPFERAETAEMKKLLEILCMSPVAADEVCLKPGLLKK